MPTRGVVVLATEIELSRDNSGWRALSSRANVVSDSHPKKSPASHLGFPAARLVARKSTPVARTGNCRDMLGSQGGKARALYVA